MHYEKITDWLEQTHTVCGYVGDRLFPRFADLRILELGPFNGWWTQELLKYSQDITVIEAAAWACEDLQRKFGSSIKIIQDDFHYAVMQHGEFDACVLLGILYHSVAPVKLLEDVANFCKPRFICIDKPRGGPIKNSVTWDVESTNIPGSRQAPPRSSKIVFQLSELILDTAMQNLDYALVDEIRVSDTDLLKMPGLSFKAGMTISVYQRQ